MVSFEEFAQFIRETTKYKKPIGPETDLVYDIGLAGIIGEDFAAALANTYGFELTEDEITAHFGDEVGISPWHHVLWLLGKMERLKPLLVGDLHSRILAKEADTVKSQRSEA